MKPAANMKAGKNLFICTRHKIILEFDLVVLIEYHSNHSNNNVLIPTISKKCRMFYCVQTHKS